MQEDNFLTGRKILIAEDDENSFLLLEYSLKPYGGEIMHSGCGEETIQLLRDNPDICLILMDIKMPGMNGIETTRKIREFNTDVSIIIQTAMVFKEDEKQKVIKAGCNDILIKPFERETLLKIIKEHLPR